MGLQESIVTCFSKYVEFTGRASRSEYWYWVLFVVVVSLVLQMAGHLVHARGVLAGIFHLAVLLPGIAVGVRRLHDVDKSGWLALIAFIPLIGALVLLYFAVQPGTQGPNRFGPQTV